MGYKVGDKVILKDEVVENSDRCSIRALKGKTGVVKEVRGNGIICVYYGPTYKQGRLLCSKASNFVREDYYADYQADRMEEAAARANRAMWNWREEQGHW